MDRETFFEYVFPEIMEIVESASLAMPYCYEGPRPGQEGSFTLYLNSIKNHGVLRKCMLRKAGLSQALTIREMPWQSIFNELMRKAMEDSTALVCVKDRPTKPAHTFSEKATLISLEGLTNVQVFYLTQALQSLLLLEDIRAQLVVCEVDGHGVLAVVFAKSNVLFRKFQRVMAGAPSDGFFHKGGMLSMTSSKKCKLAGLAEDHANSTLEAYLTGVAGSGLFHAKKSKVTVEELGPDSGGDSGPVYEEYDDAVGGWDEVKRSSL